MLTTKQARLCEPAAITEKLSIKNDDSAKWLSNVDHDGFLCGVFYFYRTVRLETIVSLQTENLNYKILT